MAMTTEHQLEIPGIGQQKARLVDWKRENNIHTHHCPDIERAPWVCWQGEEGEAEAVEYLEDEGEDGFGTGMTESAAIVDYCNKVGLKRPFWWT